MNIRSTGLASALALLLVSGIGVTSADARRGGSFGSRGMRTYNAPRSVYPASRPLAPIERSMTPRDQTASTGAYGQSYAQQAGRTGGRFGGFGGGLIGGLLAGGLIGHFLGGGMGGGWESGGGGFLVAVLQIAILAGIAWLIVGIVRRRSGSASAPVRSFGSPGSANGGSWGSTASSPPAVQTEDVDIPLTPRDKNAFERLLIDLQDAFGKEDYARLRTLTTPEVMSYLSEELGQNAARGLRNAVSDTRLLDAKVSEAWTEAGGDYATILFTYESVDVMRDRASDAIVDGAKAELTETTETWTFLRAGGRPWLVSAIQEA